MLINSAMNKKKTIEYVTPDGEIFKGSVTEIAKDAKVSPKTIYKYIDDQGKVGREKLGKVEIVGKVEPITLNAKAIIESTPKSETDTEEGAEPIEPNSERENTTPIAHPSTPQPNKLPRGNCMKCNQLTFRTEIINGKYQFKCHQPCSPKRKDKKVPYQPKTCVEGTSPYIVAVIERINNNLNGKMFNQTKHYEPA